MAAFATDDGDAGLLRAYARGDERAFSDLLDRYGSRVVQLVRCRLGPRNLWVEDVAQRLLQQTRTALRTLTLDDATPGFDAAVTQRLRHRQEPWRWLSAVAAVAAAAVLGVFVLQGSDPVGPPASRKAPASPALPALAALPAPVLDLQPGWNDGLPLAADCGQVDAATCVVEVPCLTGECQEPDRVADARSGPSQFSATAN